MNTTHMHLNAARTLLSTITTDQVREAVGWWADELCGVENAQGVAACWAKHRDAFEDRGDAVLALMHTITLAAMSDYGVSTSEASSLVLDAVAARAIAAFDAANADAD